MTETNLSRYYRIDPTHPSQDIHQTARGLAGRRGCSPAPSVCTPCVPCPAAHYESCSTQPASWNNIEQCL